MQRAVDGEHPAEHGEDALGRDDHAGVEPRVHGLAGPEGWAIRAVGRRKESIGDARGECGAVRGSDVLKYGMSSLSVV